MLSAPVLETRHLLTLRKLRAICNRPGRLLVLGRPVTLRRHRPASATQAPAQ